MRSLGLACKGTLLNVGAADVPSDRVGIEMLLDVHTLRTYHHLPLHPPVVKPNLAGKLPGLNREGHSRKLQLRG